MANSISLSTGKVFDTEVQVLKENQIVIGYGYAMCESRYVVYKIENNNGYVYRLIDLDTKELMQIDRIQPLHEKYGIGMYYNALKPEFMDAFEMAILRQEAEALAHTPVGVAHTADIPAEPITRNYTIVDYSEKSVAIFGDTKAIKDQLISLGGRFNLYLTFILKHAQLQPRWAIEFSVT